MGYCLEKPRLSQAVRFTPFYFTEPRSLPKISTKILNCPLRNPSNLALGYRLVHQLRRRQIFRSPRPTGSWNLTGPAGQIHRNTDAGRTTRSRCTSDAAERGRLRGFTSWSISPRVIMRMGKNRTHSVTPTVNPLVKTCFTQPSWAAWPVGVTVREASQCCVLHNAKMFKGTSRTVRATEAVADNVRRARRGVGDFLSNIVGRQGTCCEGEEELEIHVGDVGWYGLIGGLLVRPALNDNKKYY